MMALFVSYVATGVTASGVHQCRAGLKYTMCQHTYMVELYWWEVYSCRASP